MFEKINNFIYRLGDFNHMFVGLVIMLLFSCLVFISKSFAPYLYFVATFITGFYYGKEHWTFIRLGELPSLNPKNWSKHDRNQSYYVWIAVWVYAIVFNKFIINLI